MPVHGILATLPKAYSTTLLLTPARGRQLRRAPHLPRDLRRQVTASCPTLRRPALEHRAPHLPFSSPRGTSGLLTPVVLDLPAESNSSRARDSSHSCDPVLAEVVSVILTRSSQPAAHRSAGPKLAAKRSHLRAPTCSRARCAGDPVLPRLAPPGSATPATG